MSDNIFHIQAWTPKVTKVAQDIIDAVHSVAPELGVLFMGAAALGLPGKNDIDLCNRLHVDLGKAFQAKEAKNTTRVWE